MKVLFLTLVRIEDIRDKNIYADLMRKFRDEGHEVYIVTPIERRYKQKTILVSSERTNILRVKTLNIQKTNVVEKGISTLLIERLYLSAIRKYFLSVKFDLILYSTPPITFTKVIRFIREKCGARTYLLLKDIFPQNAVDLGMIRKDGNIHRYLKLKEKELYQISDFIGCMSPANVSYLVKHNPSIIPDKIEINPNSIEPDVIEMSVDEKRRIREFHNIPSDSTAFIYGGNLGKPQGIDFLIAVLESNKENNKVYFIIVGSGTEFSKIDNWIKVVRPINVKLIAGLPKVEYDSLLHACDVGLIFLDKRFTIPNFPSRLLSYLENKMPVIAATDQNTDLGKIMEGNDFGFWAESGDLSGMNRCIDRIANNHDLIQEMGQKGFDYMQKNYTVSNSYLKIMNHFKDTN